MEKQYTAVLYTDGSARPNPGWFGWGCHGYIHDNEVYSPKKDDAFYCLEKSYVDKKTFESFSEKQTLVSPVVYIDFVGPSSVWSSNNWAEISALYESLMNIRTKYNIRKWFIHTDSEYVRKGITEYIHVWKKNNWIKTDGSSVKNEDLWKRLDFLIETIRKEGGEFQIDRIEAHKGLLGNTQADHLSVIAMNRSRTQKEDIKVQLDYSPVKKYWRNTKPDCVENRHPLICFKRIYFNSLAQHNYMGYYYLVESGTKGENKEKMNGKRTSEAAFAVVKLDIPDAIIEMVRKKQIEECDGINIVTSMFLDHISSKEIAGYLEKYGDSCLQVNRKNYNIEFLDRRTICETLNPSNLTPRTIDMLNFLERILNEIRGSNASKENSVFGSPKINVVNATDHFFEFNKKGKQTLKKEFGVGVKGTKLITDLVNGSDVYEKTTIPIAIGLDTPDRNSLAKLADYKSKISLVYWFDSEQCVSYATYLECENGYGLWANAFSNKIYLNKKQPLAPVAS